MLQTISSLDAKTMVLLSAVLFLSLAVGMGYTFFYRKTYPGFGLLTIGQFVWSLGVFLIFYRVLGEIPSLAIGNILLLLQGVFWYHGLAMYGEINAIRLRSGINFIITILCLCAMLYYLFGEYNTCRRIVAISMACTIVYIRIALEPFLVRRWRTYPMQTVFSAVLFFVAISYAIRAKNAFLATHCVPGGPDVINKMLLLASVFLVSLLVFCLISMNSGRVEAELCATRDALRQQAQTDFLTGLPNRRYFLLQARAALAQVRERGDFASLVMLDLDHFKQINDTYGHQAGDTVLRGVGQCLREMLRGYDVLGRLGGEEFGVLLPCLDATAAFAVAERLREAVAGLHPGGYAVTASFGVAAGGQELDLLLAKADAGLYKAKKSGRNRVAADGALDVSAREACA